MRGVAAPPKSGTRPLQRTLGVSDNERGTTEACYGRGQGTIDADEAVGFPRTSAPPTS